jgi:ribose 5-phosphate isomerase B
MIYLGADHRGYYLKEKIKEYLKSHKLEFEDLGNFVFDRNDDYPDFAKLVAKKVSQKPKVNLGILMCGSGQGVCITANKYSHVRAALCLSSWMAQKARQDDSINILCLAGDLTDPQTSFRVINSFLKTKPCQKERYLRRVRKISQIEKQLK